MPFWMLGLRPPLLTYDSWQSVAVAALIAGTVLAIVCYGVSLNLRGERVVPPIRTW